MENNDGQRKLTSLPESSDDSSQNEQQQGANYGDDRERLSKKTNSTESTQKASDSPRINFYLMSNYCYGAAIGAFAYQILVAGASRSYRGPAAAAHPMCTFQRDGECVATNTERGCCSAQGVG